ncbi:MAG: DUF554 domain-containing protein [Anaerolineae bacterium]|nr:DUF554 domain-containing protein [Anaerolineae bacterium]
MSGTILNVITIILGSLIGMTVGNRLPKQVQESVMTGLGFVTLVIALQNAAKSGNIMIPLLSTVIGVIIGELIGIDTGVRRFGGWLQEKSAQWSKETDSTGHERARFINGFVSASLIFCVGPMTVIGSVQNGVDPNNMQLLAIKSALDFFAAMALASSLGLGVAFSAATALIIQGGFAVVGIFIGGALSAGALDPNNPYLREMTGAGGIIMIGIPLLLLELKQIRLSNFLPALVIAPLLVWLAAILGIKIYF